MRLHNSLSALFPGPLASVLEVLARTDRPLTGRGVAALARPQMSHVTARTALRHLVEQGLVEQELVGRAHIYSFNRDHLAAPSVEQLLGLGAIFEEELRREFASWDPVPEAAWIFGSVARHEDGPSSDVDLLLVRPAEVAADDDEWWCQITELLLWVEKTTGNPCEVVEMDRLELERARESGERLPGDLRDHAVAVYGMSPRELLLPVTA